MDLWTHVLEVIRKRIPERPYQTWFEPTRLLKADAGRLTVEVPNQLFQQWLNSTYGELLHEVGTGLEPPVKGFRFVVREGSPAPRAGQGNGNGGGRGQRGDGRPGAGIGADALSRACVLNGRYTFGSFVVSSCNQFAHAAAQAVAEKPSHSYNPLYVYGGVGLGKTHLMHAIGNDLQHSQSGLRLHYVTAENFMNELITAIRRDRTLEFKEKYRDVDVLLMDDIQFLQKKERTQEEFFHTFNQLYDLQKQIVLTSDCPPREIPALEERLRSRFEWGLIADIQPPDLETKIAILNKKAEAAAVDLPDDVAMFVASRVKSNIRELEGCLIKLSAYASLMRRQIDLEMAREVLQDLVREGSPGFNVEAIQRTVAQAFGVKVAQIRTRDNSRDVAQARHVAMYICKELTALSYPEIGRRFGGKHHSTVLHGYRKIDRQRKESTEFDRRVTALIESFR